MHQQMKDLSRELESPSLRRELQGRSLSNQKDLSARNQAAKVAASKKKREEKADLTEIERLTGLTRDQIPSFTESNFNKTIVKETKVVAP